MTEKKKKDKYMEMYDKLLDYEHKEHLRNQKKIRIGIRLLWIIPIAFLALLFITQSNKIIFLVLWIVSLFAIAIYLILTEYRDYKLQSTINDISGKTNADVEELISLDAAEARIEARANAAKEHIESRMEELKF